jgi:sulfur-carrier protein
MPTVLIPSILRPHTGGADRVEVTASTVEQAVSALELRFPEAGQRLRQALVRRYVIVSIDGQDIREREGLHTSIGEGQELHLLWAVAGG